MSTLRRGRLGILVVLCILAFPLINHQFPLVSATGAVYISPPGVPIQSVGTSFTVSVQVAGIEPFNGWDILIKTDSSVINATSFSLSQNIFDVNATGNQRLEAKHCINGVNYAGPTDCSSDGLGSVHSAVVYFASSPHLASGDGLLFNITYKVVGSGIYSPIQFQSIIITNGTPNPVLLSQQNGLYGIAPGQGFKLTASPQTVRMLVGSKQQVTLNVSSYGGYSGTVNLNPSVSIGGLNLYLNVSSVSIASGQPAFANLTIVSDPSFTATQYSMLVTATSSGFLQTTIVTVNTLERPDFLLGVSPSLLKVHATNSGSSVVTIVADPGFSGSVHLKMDVPPVPGLVASLAQTDFNVSQANPGSAVFAVRTPPSDFPFVYLINITATSQFSSHPPFTITVKSPSPNFSFQIGGSSFAVQAGQSKTFVLNTTSVDYFKGQVYLLASSLSGIKEVFSRSSLNLQFNSSTSLMTITTDNYLSTGNHFINVTALGTTFLGVPVNHSIIVAVTVTPVPASRTILGLQPTAYFGVIGVLWLGLIGIAVREIRKEKPRRFLD